MFSGLSDNIYFGEYLSNLRIRNVYLLLVAHININSIRDHFDQLVSGIKNNIDVLMISEAKIDKSLLNMQFHVEGYGNCVYRLDQNEYGSGISVYVREAVPSKLIPASNSLSMDIFHRIKFEKQNGFYCDVIPIIVD